MVESFGKLQKSRTPDGSARRLATVMVLVSIVIFVALASGLGILLASELVPTEEVAITIVDTEDVQRRTGGRYNRGTRYTSDVLGVTADGTGFRKESIEIVAAINGRLPASGTGQVSPVTGRVRDISVNGVSTANPDGVPTTTYLFGGALSLALLGFFGYVARDNFRQAGSLSAPMKVVAFGLAVATAFAVWNAMTRETYNPDETQAKVADSRWHERQTR